MGSIASCPSFIRIGSFTSRSFSWEVLPLGVGCDISSQLFYAESVQVAVFMEESSEVLAESRKSKMLLREIPRSRAMIHDLPKDLGS